MATYSELHEILGNEDLRNRVAVACIVVADAITEEDAATENHANRLLWAKQAFTNAQAMAENVTPAVIGANSGATSGQILAATDQSIFNNVAAVVDTFADGS